MNILLFLFVSVFFNIIYATVPGEINPESIEIEIGASVNITCRMNQTYFQGRNSTDLYFVNDATKKRIPQEDVMIVNNTTITYMIRNAQEQISTYLCKCGIHALAQAYVYVGYPPSKLPVTDFKCCSYDFEYMVCNFTKPNNPVYTQYKLTFYTQSPDYKYNATCNYDDKTVCNITRPNADHYNFTLKSENTLGSSIKYFYINNWDHVIPAKPGYDLRIIKITTNSFQAAWKMPKWEKYKTKGLEWDVQLIPQHTKTIPNLKFYRNEMHLQLNGLPYAYYNYNLTLRIRVNNTSSDESMWSEPFFLNFRTAARLPDRPPRTNAGSFYIDSTETYVRLYWELLDTFEYNGYNFNYTISEMRLNGSVVQHPYMRFDTNSVVLPWNKYTYYEFHIRSLNHVGESQNASSITIHPMHIKSFKNYKPLAIHNVYHALNRTFTLTWDAPIITTGLRSYTVYWCNSKTALHNECNGSVHFEQFDRSVHKFTTKPQENMPNFAVSANYDNYNSGMHWTTCTMDENSDLIKMEPKEQHITASTITIQWSPESFCASILEGYNITYCEVANTNAPCIEPLKYKIMGRDSKRLTITQLKPFTIYRIAMFMFSHAKEGKLSDPLFVRTFESAPSPPRQLQVSNITNSSALLTWLPPSQPNGHIRGYIVIVNGERFRVPINETTTDITKKIIYNLQNLFGYTAYKAYVIAENSESSDTSNDIHFTTLIGYPSLPGSVILIRDTNNETVVQWSEPVQPAGPLNFYEVAVTQKRNDEVIARRISIVEALNCSLKIPSCIDHEYKTTLEVRAVNAAEMNDIAEENLSHYVAWDPDINYYDGNDELQCSDGKIRNNKYLNNSIYQLYKSQWQQGTTYGCSANRLSKITKIALLFVVLSLCAMMAVYMARKQYNKMANINCTLPSGFMDFEVPKDGTEIFGQDVLNSSKDVQTSKLDQSKEFIYHNEKHHLLSSVVNDSGYMIEAQKFDSDINVLPFNETNNIMQKPIDYIRTNSESSTESTGEIINNYQQTEDNDAYKGTNKIEQNIEMLPKNTGYVRPENVMKWYEQKEMHDDLEKQNQTPENTNNGYVTVDTLKSLNKLPLDNVTTTAVKSNGYVQPFDLNQSASQQNSIVHNIPKTNTSGYIQHTEPFKDVVSILPKSNDGYTTIGDLNVLNKINSINRESDTLPPSNISGYVTPQDLSAYGQQQLY